VRGEGKGGGGGGGGGGLRGGGAFGEEGFGGGGALGEEGGDGDFGGGDRGEEGGETRGEPEKGDPPERLPRMRERGCSEVPRVRLRPTPGRGLRAAAASRAPRCAARPRTACAAASAARRAAASASGGAPALKDASRRSASALPPRRWRLNAVLALPPLDSQFASLQLMSTPGTFSFFSFS
jgi:hypothetical protein